jgi:hypothetical protein
LEYRNYSSITWGSDSYPLKCGYGRAYLFEMREELGFSRQLGLLDPLSVVWENIPYSFVVDWFIPIGDYLSMLNQIPFLNGRWLITDYAKWLENGPYGYTGELPYCWLHTNTQYDRIVHVPTISCSATHTHRSTEGPSVRFPEIKVLGAVHGRRIANAVALAAGRFLSK